MLGHIVLASNQSQIVPGVAKAGITKIARIALRRAATYQCIAKAAGIIDNGSKHTPHIREQNTPCCKACGPLQFDGVTRIITFAMIIRIPNTYGYAIITGGIDQPQGLPTRQKRAPVPASRYGFAVQNAAFCHLNRGRSGACAAFLKEGLIAELIVAGAIPFGCLLIDLHGTLLYCGVN